VSGDFESIEFDLVIQSNPEGLELGKCEYKISFPDSIFGSFLIQNSLVEISKGDLIDDNNDFQLTTTDAAADKLKIVVEHTGGIIGLEPIKLATVSMVAQDCNSVANIEWNGLTNNVNHTYFEDGEIMIYSSVSFEGGLTSPMCGCTLPSPNDPEIKSFSIDFTEEKIRAGTGEVLKTFGENFGNVIVNGSCYIEVENADHSFPVPNPGWSNANRTRIPLGDIIDWTNNEITFVVPSTTLGDISAPVESE
jgi:hypothetical protein